MIHLVMHLPEEALQGGPVTFRWMYPFERYMKKLKNYVRNKAKPEGSIAEGYVADEALTFCSRYFRGEIGTKFNRPTASQGCPVPTSDFQVFRSLCKKSGKETIIQLGLPEMKKVIWYVLHNSPEIDAYMDEFQSEHPDSDMQQEFPRWFEKKIGNLYIANDPRCTPDLFALACGPLSTATSIKSCVVNGVKFVVHSRDVKRTTQNSGICSPGERPGEMYYGQLDDILEFSYTQFKVVLFRVKCSHTNLTTADTILRSNVNELTPL
ncbi:hypothetical protein CTI12_AA040050 [Artemisia annua]|uniref:DUF4218 domain-containing protein n=1 Tax=Artemisia annua TaxID=35608 RepID=A0A2U1QEJ5_ARTAN|nr:hypothetical protein CTI12_AA040050 [Artemisia annua]